MVAGRCRMDGMGKRTKMDRTEFVYKPHPAAEMDQSQSHVARCLDRIYGLQDQLDPPSRRMIQKDQANPSDDFDSFSRFASRILPLPLPPPPNPNQSAIGQVRPGSTDPSGPKTDSAYTVRAIPIKIYLPDNAPVIHEMIPPLSSDGTFQLNKKSRG